MFYTKKPVKIEAMQFTDKTKDMCFNFVNGCNKSCSFDDNNNPVMDIETLEGVMRVSFGDYIIKGVKGEFYPCKPDIFELTYDSI